MPLTKEEKKQKKKLAERRRMEKIRNDPEKYAEWKLKMKELYLKRKREGKITSVKNLTPKQKKIARKKSRESSKRCYYKKKLKENKIDSEEEIIDERDTVEDNDPLDLELPTSPQVSNDPLDFELPTSPQVSATLKSPVLISTPISSPVTRSKIREKRPIEIDLNLTENETDVSFNAHVPSRIIRSISPQSLISDSPRTPSPQNSITSSPSSVISPIRKKPAKKLSVKNKSPWKHILRKLQYRRNKEIQLKDQKIIELKRLNESYRKKIKRLQKDKHVTETRKKHKINLSENKITQPVIESCVRSVKENVVKYFEEDENSRMCAGKKEFITRGKVRKQKRYLNDSLQNLHKRYLENNSQHLSYSTFCKLRPFWVLIPNINIRETCLCKDHENMELVVAALRKNDLINEKSVNEILQSLCCDARNVNCLTKNCDSCKNKVIIYKEFDNTKETHYWIWNKVKKTYFKDGIEKVTLQTTKEKVAACPKDIITHFEELIVPYMRHCGNIISQYKYCKELKENLKPEECIIHCDFSENYTTKYATEIQSVHFSRQPVTLHTSVIYYIRDGNLCKQSYCTISECLRHDAVAIWEHLMPILRFLENEAPEVTTFHFISDSPSAQYRNRKMFYVMAKMHWYFPSLQLLIWNYSEKGHGKGAPDGVGGVLKRTADQIVARGDDIPSIEVLVRQLKNHCRGVIIEVVHESGILEKEMLIPEKLKGFRGTMQTHQVVWSSRQPQTLALRELSCRLGTCSQEAIHCPHGKHIAFYIIEDITNKHQRSTNVNSANKQKLTSKKAKCSSLIKQSKKSGTKIQTNNYSNTTNQDLELSDNDSFWVETSSIDEKLITPKFTKDVLSTLHQKSTDDLSDSDDEEIFVFKKPQRTKESIGIVEEDMIVPSCSKDSRSRQKEKRYKDDTDNFLIPCKQPRKFFL